MNTQQEALRLADAIDGAYWEWKDVPKMATELRRLHEVNQMLVDALKDISLFGEEDSRQTARTALAKLKEKNT